MNRSEIRAVVSLSLISALRMLGMFMVLPVFALYAAHLPGGATPLQVGLAIGAYGLVQAVLQIPFGLISDRIGRRPVIVAGLLLFAIGSFVAGASRDIHIILLGRVLQGAGAISGVLAALLADITRVQVRTAAMAIYGAGMGAAFIVALVVGPLLSGVIGVDGLFTLTGVLALLAIPFLLVLVDEPPQHAVEAGRTMSGLRAVLVDPQLLRLDGGIFLLHTMMTALFIAAPHAIETTLGLPAARHWQVYLPVLLVSVVPVLLAIRRIERDGHTRAVFVGSVALLGVAMILAAEGWQHAAVLVGALLLFFLAFNYLEATLPSLISRRAPVQRKGAALGIYSSAQVLGGFAGGTVGGLTLGHGGITATFAAAGALSLLWLGFAAGIRAPAPQTPAADAATPRSH